MSKVKLSIIIVHYKVKNELFGCIKSIQKAKSKIPYEIIIVDNDEKKIIEHELKKIFPEVKYIKALGNIGFGAGNNLGASYAKGDFLFFLNPDTEIYSKVIDILVDFLQKNPNTAIVAPIFTDRNNKPYDLQGAKRLTPLRAIFTLSFIHRLLPNNSIAKDYLLSSWNKTKLKEVDVVPGTGFVIRTNIFEEIGGFDEKFFLYFEEFDICSRVKELGYKIYILPNARVKHIWEASTKKATFDVKKIFVQSRFYYFKKYYGFLPAFIVEIFARLNKTHLLLGFILALATFLFSRTL